MSESAIVSAVMVVCPYCKAAVRADVHFDTSEKDAEIERLRRDFSYHFDLLVECRRREEVWKQKCRELEDQVQYNRTDLMR